MASAGLLWITLAGLVCAPLAGCREQSRAARGPASTAEVGRSSIVAPPPSIAHDAAAPHASDRTTSEIFDAALLGEAERVRALVNSGVNVNARSETGRTPLMYALGPVIREPKGPRDAPSSQAPYAEKKRKTIALLLDLGADPNLRSAAGLTALHHVPLMFAPPSVEEEICKRLLDRGAELDAVTPSGESALLMAVRLERVPLARCLFRAGADPSSRDVDGNTALSTAQRLGLTELVRLFSSGEAKNR